MRDREREGKLERVSEAGGGSKTEEVKVHTCKPNDRDMFGFYQKTLRFTITLPL